VRKKREKLWKRRKVFPNVDFEKRKKVLLETAGKAKNANSEATIRAGKQRSVSTFDG